MRAQLNYNNDSSMASGKGNPDNEIPYINSETERQKNSSGHEPYMIKKPSPIKESSKILKPTIPMTSTSLNFPPTNPRPKKEDIETFLRQFIEPESGTIKSPTVSNPKSFRSKRDSKGFWVNSERKNPNKYYVANATPSIAKPNNQESFSNSKGGVSNSLSISIGEEKNNQVAALSDWKNLEMGKYKKMRYKLGKLEDVLERDRLEMLQHLQQNKNYSNMSNLVTRQLNRNVSFPPLLRFDIVNALKIQADETLKEEKAMADETLEDSYELEPVRINVEATTETSEEDGANQGENINI